MAQVQAYFRIGLRDRLGPSAWGLAPQGSRPNELGDSLQNASWISDRKLV